jgi:hypothetical protein
MVDEINKNDDINNNTENTNDTNVINLFMLKYPNIPFYLSAMNKEINRDIRINLKNNLSVKFHEQSLLQICEYEQMNLLAILVPQDFINNAIAAEILDEE